MEPVFESQFGLGTKSGLSSASRVETWVTRYGFRLANRYSFLGSALEFTGCQMAGVLHDFSWKRMVEAVEAVRERACRATAALQRAGIPYAIAGGNAVAAWVARVDLAAVRNTQDVDILVRRSDFEGVKAALETVGFIHHNIMDVECFIDGPKGSPRDAVHLVFAGEKVRETHVLPSADISEAVAAENYSILSLNALVQMKLNSFRRKDQVHLLDLLEVGLIDATWLPQLPPEHAARLQQLIDDPDG